MKTKNKAILLIVLFVLILVIIFNIEQEDPELFVPDKYCKQDSDCVPNKRCHPIEVVNKNYQLPIENETGCTLDCQTILDCGRGQPICRMNRCVVKRIW